MASIQQKDPNNRLIKVVIVTNQADSGLGIEPNMEGKAYRILKYLNEL